MYPYDLYHCIKIVHNGVTLISENNIPLTFGKFMHGIL